MSQSAWTAPAGPFKLAVTAGGLSAQDRIDVRVYPALLSRSALQLTEHGVELAPPIASQSWTVGSFGADRVLHLRLAPDVSSPVGVGELSTGLGSGCAPACDGVYPVVVGLRSPSGRALSSLTTHMVVTAPATVPLRFSWVLPLQARLQLARSRTLSLGASAVTSVQSVAASFTAVAGGEPTLAPSPATMQALADTPSLAAKDALGALAGWATTPGNEVLGRAFAPVSISQLGRAGLGNQVAPQLSLGAHVVAGVLGARTSPNPWVGGDGTTARALRLLPTSVRDLLLPSRDLIRPTSLLTPDHPFILRVGGTRYMAMASDPALAAEAASAPGQPRLAAYNVLADLAQTYFEQPFATRPRGVALILPPSAAAQPAFLQALQDGLAGSPVLDTVPLAQLFASSGGTTGADGTAWSLQASPSPFIQGGRAWSASVARSVQQLQELSSAIGADASGMPAMRELIDVAESSGISPQLRQTMLSAFSGGLRSAISGIQVAGAGSVTLTSRTGDIPITLVSASPRHVTARLKLSSDELSFPQGASRLVHLGSRNTVVDVPVRARAAGVFPARVVLLAPSGRLVLASRRLTIRSTAVSAVAIALTAGAAMVLAAWWIRSSTRARRARASSAAT